MTEDGPFRNAGIYVRFFLPPPDAKKRSKEIGETV